MAHGLLEPQRDELPKPELNPLKSLEMKPLRVLKLGWEFPPLVNGGLGVACFGLSRALAKQVNLTVVVPKSRTGVIDSGFRLLGSESLGHANHEPDGKNEGYESFAKVRNIPVFLDPYAGNPQGSSEGAHSRRKFSGSPDAGYFPFPEDDELYGPDLGRKVFEFTRMVTALAMSETFDIIHAHDWMTFLAGVELKKATGKPLVLHVHALQYDRAGASDRSWIYDIEKHGMEQADRIIPVSHYTAEIITAHYGIHPDKIRPVHNGADPVETFATKKKFPEKLVLFLGRLTSQKGPEFFLDTAARVIAMNPGVRFVVAGTGDKLRPLIESGAFRGLGDHFHFTGFLDKEKVHELLSMTDVYCMPSVSEPFGLSALEAAQFGIPAVISRQSGVSEVLKAALMADFWDVELMSRHINDLLTNDELRARVVEQAKLDIAASTWDAAAIKVIGIYKELVD